MLIGSSSTMMNFRASQEIAASSLLNFRAGSPDRRAGQAAGNGLGRGADWAILQSAVPAAMGAGTHDALPGPAHPPARRRFPPTLFLGQFFQLGRRIW